MSFIHTTIGVYPSLDKKMNGVTSENLANHIKYNVSFRPGRALFLDGVCIYAGSLNSDQINMLEAEFKSDANAYVLKINTQPYQ